MAFPWGLVLFIVGILYGYFVKGSQDKGDLFRRGLVIGLILAIALAVIGLLTGAPALGIAGGFGVFISAVVLTLLFILGVWLGDVLEPSSRRR